MRMIVIAAAALLLAGQAAAQTPPQGERKETLSEVMEALSAIGYSAMAARQCGLRGEAWHFYLANRMLQTVLRAGREIPTAYGNAEATRAFLAGALASAEFLAKSDVEQQRATLCPRLAGAAILQTLDGMAR